MSLDPRTVKALLKYAKEYSKDFAEIEVISEGVTVRVKRGQEQPQPARPGAKQPDSRQELPKRNAIDSLRLDPPVFNA